MQKYIDMVQDVLTYGYPKRNRTGIATLSKFGRMLKFDLSSGRFPALTIKRLYWRAAFAEMIGFLRGYDNAAQFRAIGCNVWDANANETESWVKSQFRRGEDDLGRIYGVQWRDWTSPTGRKFDQVLTVYKKLKNREDDRRLIISAWNPGELEMMALPPCHMFMQFNIEGSRLNLLVYIRSNDLGLGAPFNIAQYAFLLCLMARITDFTPGILSYAVGDYHVYENHIAGLGEAIHRTPFAPPALAIHPDIKTLEDIEDESLCLRDTFDLLGYHSHPAVKLEMAV